MDLANGSPIPVSGLIRSARAVADLSQRGLARRSGIAKSVVSRMETDETGEHTSLSAFVRALNACGFTVTVHAGGRKLRPDDDPERDRGHRKFPPHLEPHAPMRLEEWWGVRRFASFSELLAALPPRIYHVNPWHRQRHREALHYPWSARFWEDTAHLAPSFGVHPWLARRRMQLTEWEQQAATWHAQEARLLREVAEQRAGLAARDGGADEGGGEVAEPLP